MRPLGSHDSKKRNRGWNVQQIEILQKEYYKINLEELSRKIGKSIRQIRKKGREIGLPQKKRGRKKSPAINI
jgi:hypothetical protein